MDNSTVAPLQGETLLLTQLELVTPTTVAGTLYGIAFTLFCLYVHSIVPRFQDDDRRQQAKFMLGYSSVIMLCGLHILVANAWLIQDAYIEHSDYPEGPYFYEVTIFQTPLVISLLTCQMVIDTLTSAVQIWRVWVVWSATRYAKLVIVLPSLCFLAFTGLRLRTTVVYAIQSIPNAQLDDKIELVETALQGAVTVLCTMLISLYLIFQHWHQRKLIGKDQGSVGYMNIVAMLIESYALESMWLLIAAIIWNNVAGAFFIESISYVEIIAYLLVQYQVASGTAYKSQKGQSNISSLHWNHSNHAATQFGETSELYGGPEVPAKLETLEVLPASSMA